MSLDLKTIAFRTAACLALLAATALVFGQSDSRQLNAELGKLYERGDLDAAIPIAEKIVEVERRSVPVSIRNLTNALENLSQIRLDRGRRSMNALRSSEVAKERAMALVIQMRSDLTEAEKHLREAIQISGAANPDPSQQAVSIRSNLAWILYNFIASETSSSLGFDKDSRSRIEMQERAAYTGRFEEARKLYVEAVSLADAAPDQALKQAADLNLAEFETAMGNFEIAIPIYARLTSAAEAAFGTRDPLLLSVYEPYLKVLLAAYQLNEASEILSRTVLVSGRSAEYPRVLLNLTHRAERPFQAFNSKRVETSSRALKQQTELSGRASVAAVAGSGGDVVSASLSASTLGQDYYETGRSNTIKMRKVAVRVEVDETGRVRSAEGLSSDRGMKESAEEAIKEWRFRPLIVDGKATAMKGYAEVTILFY